MQSQQAMAELEGHVPRTVPFWWTSLQSEEAIAERYWTLNWSGPEGKSEIVADLWSGAVGIVHHSSGSEEGVDSIIHLPELKIKMQKRFGSLAQSYPSMKDRAAKAGFGASWLLHYFMTRHLGTASRRLMASCSPLQT